MSKSDLDNHTNQLNPEHDAYWQSRGYNERPDDDDDDDDVPYYPSPVPHHRFGWFERY